MAAVFDPYVQGSGAGELSAEDEIAIEVTRSVFPALRAALVKLKELKDVSNVNGLPTKIADAQTNGTLLAGFSGDDWANWVEARDLLLTFATTAQPTLGGTTVAQVLLKRYPKQG